MTDDNDKNEILSSASRGLVRQASNLFRRGLEDLSQLVGADADAEAWTRKGGELWQLDRYEEALSCYNRALELNQNHAVALLLKAICLGSLNRFDEALVCLESASKSSLRGEDVRFDEEVWFWKGAMLRSLDRFQESVLCFDRLLGMAPDRFAAWDGKGRSLMCLDRFGEALACWEKACALELDNRDAWVYRGAILVKFDRFAEALACWEKVCSLDPKDYEAWLNRALAEERLGQDRGAVNSFERFLSVAPRDPKDQSTQDAIEYARRRLGELKAGGQSSR
jgi:tetratricopeptide (TPR) repeat protein